MTGNRLENRRGKPGFTLLEIMIVVGIVGLLAAIAVPSYLYARRRARATTMADELRALCEAFELYNLENGRWPTPSAGPGDFPAGMSTYVEERYWTNGVIGGGTYMWLYYDPVTSYVVYIDNVQHTNIMRSVDKIIDDGDLGSGAFRRGNGANFYRIVGR
jgi:type II secretion system protein G